jgi:hypothetical protein
MHNMLDVVDQMISLPKPRFVGPVALVEFDVHPNLNQTVDLSALIGSCFHMGAQVALSRPSGSVSLLASHDHAIIAIFAAPRLP